MTCCYERPRHRRRGPGLGPPQYDQFWFQIPHLLKLNLVLMVPLMSSAVAGYDGTSFALVHGSVLTLQAPL